MNKSTTTNKAWTDYFSDDATAVCLLSKRMADGGWRMADGGWRGGPCLEPRPTLAYHILFFL
jgi:hypothetical protein